MSRWNQVVMVLLCCVLWCSHAALAVDDCSPQGPDNCTFETNVDLARGTSDSTLCSWTPNNWEHYYLTAYPWDEFVGLSWNNVTGRVTSRKSCSTQGQEFCFFFRYQFEVANEIDLNVYIQNTTSQSEKKVWSASSAGFLYSFQQAYIPISTQYDYAVVFEATRRSALSPNNTLSVYVDDLQFVQSPCPTCFTEGPENCTFQIDYSVTVSTFTSCSWTSSGGWSGFRETSSQKYLSLDWDKSYGQLTSRPACSTNGQTHCLMFDYKFSESDTVNLTVFIQESQSGGRKVIVWSEQRVVKDGFWEFAFVPVNTSYDFVVVFEATRLSDETLSSDMTVCIDNIAYTSILCTSVMSTTDTPTTSTPHTTNTSIPLTTPDINNTSPVTFPETTTPDINNTSPVTFPETTTPDINNTSPVTFPETTPKTTDNVPLIAGLTVACAAVVILFVSVIVVFILRRRRRQNSCAPKAQVEYVFHNTAYNIESSADNDEEEAEYSEIVDLVESNSQPIPVNISVDAEEKAEYSEIVHVVESNSQPTPFNISVANIKGSPDRRADSNNRNRNDQTTPKPPVRNSASKLKSFQKDTLADYDEISNLNINSQLSPTTALTDLAANIESPPEEVHDHHGIVENLNRKRSSQTLPKTPRTDSDANVENSPQERAGYERLSRNRSSQTLPKTHRTDSTENNESPERAGYERLNRNRSSQTLPKTPITDSAENIESPERAGYERLNRNRSSQTLPKTPRTDSAENIECSAEERAGYERLNRNRSSQTLPKTPSTDSAANAENSPEERAGYERLNRNRSSQTLPKTPRTDSEADIESSAEERAGYERLNRNRSSQTLPKTHRIDSAENIESPERAGYERLNRNRSSQTLPKTPITDSAENIESPERAGYERLNRNRSSQTFPKLPSTDSPANVENSHRERAGYERLNGNRSSQTLPKTQRTDSEANIESSPEERAGYENLNINRTSQTSQKTPVSNSSENIANSPENPVTESEADIESSPEERAGYENVNRNRSSQTLPKTPRTDSAENIKSQEGRAGYENLNRNRSSQTFPKTPRSESDANVTSSPCEEIADHETSQTLPKVPFTTDTGGSENNRTESVVNDSVQLPSEMYSRLLSHTDQEHAYSKLKSGAPAAECESEDG